VVPEIRVAVIVLVADDPCVIVRLPELASEKLKGLVLTVKPTVVNLLRLPAVPFTANE
jgi:hypothetical protein